MREKICSLSLFRSVFPFSFHPFRNKFIVFNRFGIGDWKLGKEVSFCSFVCKERLRSACFEHNKTKLAIGRNGHFPEHHFRSRKVLPLRDKKLKYFHA